MVTITLTQASPGHSTPSESLIDRLPIKEGWPNGLVPLPVASFIIRLRDQRSRSSYHCEVYDQENSLPKEVAEQIIACRFQRYDQYRTAFNSPEALMQAVLNREFVSHVLYRHAGDSKFFIGHAAVEQGVLCENHLIAIMAPLGVPFKSITEKLIKSILTQIGPKAALLAELVTFRPRIGADQDRTPPNVAPKSFYALLGKIFETCQGAWKTAACGFSIFNVDKLFPPLANAKDIRQGTLCYALFMPESAKELSYTCYIPDDFKILADKVCEAFGLSRHFIQPPEDYTREGPRDITSSTESITESITGFDQVLAFEDYKNGKQNINKEHHLSVVIDASKPSAIEQWEELKAEGFRIAAYIPDPEGEDKFVAQLIPRYDFQAVLADLRRIEDWQGNETIFKNLVTTCIKHFCSSEQENNPIPPPV